MTQLSPLLAELEAVYPKLLEEYATSLPTARLDTPEGGWPRPVITLASKGRKRTQVGWYTPAVWKDGAEDVLGALAGVNSTDLENLPRQGEITIATEIVSEPVKAVGELLRQMYVHHYSMVYHSTKCVGANGAYYPIEWMGYGMRLNHNAYVLDNQPSRGWAGWEPNEDFREWVYANVNLGVFQAERKSTDPNKPGPGSRMKKWQCNCTVIRSATKVNAVCQECGQQFWWAEKREEAPDGYHRHEDDRDIPNVKGLPPQQPTLHMPEWVNNLAQAAGGN